MGDPKKPKKKYNAPTHPWNKERIEAEKILTREYGLKNKKEIWRMNSLLKNFSKQAKMSIITKTKQGELENQNLLKRLTKLGLIKSGGQIDDILSLTIRDICERRLQTLVVKKGFARSVKQARQFIVHRHIKLGDKKVTAPSYLVSTEEEAAMTFSENSNLANEEHPERSIQEK
ncbi:30S ribosomal protein S4 [Candidatus Woesearchaeota archaeon]|jgi:small subunit ribosomal protein S4|nr:30S ribosomal protein S4 [Candidatus Woesearchaeota archaeon]MBT6336104.1 30S ribosomal protein S4 [Candidatus Woesearchaeota archaeon]MBT7927941.1 30S ribosomal protein S4 [Candidatus Woesearchaeota archaeon]